MAFFVLRILHVPYRPEVLHRAIPENAILVSEHERLAQRWPELIENPMVLNIARASGASNRDLNELKDNIAIPAILNRFAAKKTLIAFVPVLGHTGQPAWVLASWGGIQTQLLKWGLYNPLLSDFEKVEITDGRYGWVLENAGDENVEGYLSLAVTEGVLLATFGSSREGVNVLIDRVERHAKANPEIRAALGRQAELKDAHDRGWIGMSDILRDSWSYEIAIDGDAGLKGAFSGTARLLPDGESGTVTERLTELGSILKDAPGSIVIAPFALLQSAFSPEGKTSRIRHVADQFAPHVTEGPSACVMLCAPDYYGRIFGLRISTLIVALRLKNPEGLEDTMASVLDSINAGSSTTLIRRDPRDGLPIWMIESARKGPLSRLAPTERPSCVVVGNWLLISSNYEGLKKLLQSESGASEWSAALAEHDGEVGAWVDLKLAADGISKIAAVYELSKVYDLFKRAQGKKPSSSALREHLASAKGWLERLEELERLTLWGSSMRKGCKGHFRLGAPGPLEE